MLTIDADPKLRQSLLWTIAEPSDRIPGGTWFHSAYEDRRAIAMFGSRHRTARILVREARPGEASPYFAWWQSMTYAGLGQWTAEPGGFCWLWPSRGQVEMCFPYGPRPEVEAGHGEVLNVVVEEVAEGTEIEGS